MNNAYKDNIWKFYLFKVMLTLELSVAIYVLFLLSNGLSMTQIMVLESGFTLIIFLFVVPSGAFADMFGRKTALVMSAVIGGFGFLLFGLSSTFWIFFVANMILGVAFSLVVGPGSAFVYDSLKEIGSEDSFSKVFGRVNFLELFSLGIVSLISGYLALFMDYRLLFFLTAGFFFLALFVALWFKEPPVYKHSFDKKYFKRLSSAVSFAVKHTTIRNYVIYISFFAALGNITWLVIQPYYGADSIPKYFVGVGMFFYFTSAGFGFLVADYIIKMFRKSTILYSLIFLAALSLIGMFFVGPIISFGLIFTFSFLSGVREVFIEKELHAQIDSDQRATVISLPSMSKNLMYVIFAPLVGLAVDVYSPAAAFLMMGVGLFIFSIFIVFLFNFSKSDFLT